MPLHKQCHLEQLAQHCVLSGLEYLQGQGVNDFSGQPVTAPRHFFFLLYKLFLTFLLFQFVLIMRITGGKPPPSEKYRSHSKMKHFLELLTAFYILEII